MLYGKDIISRQTQKPGKNPSCRTTSNDRDFYFHQMLP